jgi:hypothetical protein
MLAAKRRVSTIHSRGYDRLRRPESEIPRPESGDCRDIRNWYIDDGKIAAFVSQESTRHVLSVNRVSARCFRATVAI